MNPAQQMLELSKRLTSLTPEELGKLSAKIQAKESEEIARAHDMRKVYECCPAHGEPIYRVGKTKYKLWGAIFEFDNIQCGRREYCRVDISNNPQLLETLAQRTPFSIDKPFSSKLEPDLKKATGRTHDLCPYCGKSGGDSQVVAYVEGQILPRILTKRKMDCGHEYAIIYHIS